jgi:predicted Zn-dependent protease
MARNQFDLGMPNKAYQYMKTFLDKHPDEAKLIMKNDWNQLLKVGILISSGRLVEAEEVTNQSLKLQPKSSFWHAKKGLILQK